RAHARGGDPARRPLEGRAEVLLRRPAALRHVLAPAQRGRPGPCRRAAVCRHAALHGRPVPEARDRMTDADAGESPEPAPRRAAAPEPAAGATPPAHATRLRVGVLASGAGTNLQAILDRVHGGDADVVAVGSDKPDAHALARAAALGIATRAFPGRDFADREARDAARAAWLRDHGAELVVLAGYMQLVTPAFLRAFPQRVINVHPALLPAFPGLAAVEQALAYGVKVFGVTVHFVDEGVDTGPIILQRAIELPEPTEAGQVRGAPRPLEPDLLTSARRLIARGEGRIAPGSRRGHGSAA